VNDGDQLGGFQGAAGDDAVTTDGVQLVTQTMIVFSESRQLSLADAVHCLLLLHSRLQHQHLQPTNHLGYMSIQLFSVILTNYS